MEKNKLHFECLQNLIFLVFINFRINNHHTSQNCPRFHFYYYIIYFYNSIILGEHFRLIISHQPTYRYRNYGTSKTSKYNIKLL